MFPESRAKQVLKTIHFVTNSLWSVRNIRVCFFALCPNSTSLVCICWVPTRLISMTSFIVSKSHCVCWIYVRNGAKNDMTPINQPCWGFLQIRMPLEAALKGLSDLWGIKLGRSLNQFPYTAPAKKQVHGTGHLWNLLCMVLTLACLSGGGDWIWVSTLQ